MPHQETEKPFKILPKYPHLRPADVEIWQRFIQKNPGRFSRVFYDYRVGDPEDCPADFNHCAAISWHDLTRWQIDVVAEDEEKIYVIEIKPMAGSTANGQALAYAKLFEEEQKPTKPVVPVVLTDRIIKTTQRCAHHCGVELWEV